MTISAMLHLKMAQVERVALKILIFQVLFLTFLKIFLVTLVEEVEDEVEKLISEALT